MFEDYTTPSAAESRQPNNASLQTLENDLLKPLETGQEAIVAKIPDLSAQINELLAGGSNGSRGLKTLIVRTISDAADGNLVVPDYVPASKSRQRVFEFRQTHWQEMESQEFFDFVRNCCRKMMVPDSMLLNASFMNQVYEDLAHSISKACKQREVDGEVWINFLNGTLCIQKDGSSCLLPHNRDDFFRYVLPYSYDPEAQCPLWHKFLDEVLPDRTVQDVMAEGIGLCFAPGIKSEKMLVFFGHGSNGKSVVLEVASAMFGSRNVSNVTLNDLTNDDRKRFLIEGKLVNISTESDRDLNTSILKTLVSGEPINVYELYRGARIIKRYARLITSFNILPRAETTLGFYRRFLIIPFDVTIDEKDADVNLASKLKQELPGILNWVLDGLRRYLANYHFTESQPCNDALTHYKASSDSVRLFVSEACEPIDEVVLGETSGIKLFNAYKQYCIDASIKIQGRNIFYEKLERMGYKRIVNQKLISFNIKLIDEYERLV